MPAIDAVLMNTLIDTLTSTSTSTSSKAGTLLSAWDAIEAQRRVFALRSEGVKSIQILLGRSECAALMNQLQAFDSEARLDHFRYAGASIVQLDADSAFQVAPAASTVVVSHSFRRHQPALEARRISMSYLAAA